LVFFCHQNPVAWTDAPPTDPRVAERGPPSASSTDDKLFNADIARLLLTAAACPADDGIGRPVGSADALALALRTCTSGFFTDASDPGGEAEQGNRRGGKGEYVVYFKPQFDENRRVLPSVVIEVWSRQTEGPDGWAIVRTLWVDNAHTQEGPVRGGF
jgi:hypothetical protein